MMANATRTRKHFYELTAEEQQKRSDEITAEFEATIRLGYVIEMLFGSQHDEAYYREQLEINAKEYEEQEARNAARQAVQQAARCAQRT